MISVIIPTYKNPKYLAMCVDSAITGQVNKNQIIVVIDGFGDMYANLINQYKEDKKEISILEFPRNEGMQMALNIGVQNATSDKVFIVNDDNVFPKGWDVALEKNYNSNEVLTMNQIEPISSIFGFPAIDCGKTVDEFDYTKYISEEQKISSETFTNDGEIFPFLISKKWYMTVGGFDTIYKSPFWCDVDFWLKLELAGLKFKRMHERHMYHFGSASTKNRQDSDAITFRQSEEPAALTFIYKWGFLPNIQQLTMFGNRKSLGQQVVKGIDFNGGIL